MATIKVNGDIIEDIELFIFDKDGTLMDLYHYWSQMIGFRAELICKTLGIGNDHVKSLMFEMGVDTDKKRLRPEGPVGIKRREVVLQTAVDYLHSVGFSNTYDLCYGAFAEIDHHSSNNLKQLILPIDGASGLLDNIFKRNCKIAIATTDKTERGKLAMEFLGFSSKIDIVVGADMVENAKPDPEMIEEILDVLKIDRSNAVMVGDAVTDVQMGLEAGLKASIGVLTGLSNETDLYELTPYVIKSVEEIELV